MKLLLQNLNTVNYIAFLTVFVILAYLGSEHVKTFFSNLFADKKIKGVILKKKNISLREFKTLKENINNLNFRVNELNHSYLLNDNLIDIKKELKEINRQYLEIYLTLQRFLKQKNKKIKTEQKYISPNKIFNSDPKILKLLNERLRLIKNLLDTLNREQKIKIEDEHSHSLHNLSVIRTIFIPLGVYVAYLGMNLLSMSNEHDNTTHGIYSLKYGQPFIWILIILTSSLILLGFHFNILA